jgi:valyl-tRNA synthetase
MKELPESYEPTQSEARWREEWERWRIYRWDPSRPREETFVADTPPPTVSGSLHVGHVFSYTQQDVLVRYQRMRGRNIAYPMGWDDNGLPTERRVESLFGIRPNPALPYDPGWRPRRDKRKEEPVEEVSRESFIRACGMVMEEDEKAFEELWRRLGLSVDWTLIYRTLDAHCRRLSQLSFLDLLRKGDVYQALAPTMWDVDLQTAVAQAEVEDREVEGSYHDVRFGVEGGGSFVVSTTRPELLGACIAVVAHPEDPRYRGMFGKTALTPLLHAPVPILPSDHADPEKGTGILMVCTFGDQMDVEFWKRSGLPLKQLIGRDGRLLALRYGEPPYESRQPEKARDAYSKLQGRTVQEARRRAAELLRAESSLVGEPRRIRHPVRFYERGERPLEYAPTRQWFVRLLDRKRELIEQGRKIRWHPEHMQARYENWVEGLNQDWCISRQRYSGVPFPLWYPCGPDGAPAYEAPIRAREEDLPVDPRVQAPPERDPSDRDRPGGFTGDPDVMDTWATSSLTPQILSHWRLDPARHQRLFPADIRPQAHEIIRTWTFYTIVKAWLHDRAIPWRHVLISGWVLDPDRKKMAKSRGKAVTPEDLLQEFSADAIRYWAARARLGADTAFDPKVFKIGRRLCTKIFNASRFVLSQLDRGGPGAYRHSAEEIREPIDRALAARLAALVERATESFEAFDYAAALQLTEEAFWHFCDDYLELVKVRSYGEDDSPQRRSAHATLGLALRSFLRLFAPALPYVTEEVWSWRFAGEGRLRSVHTALWPTPAETASLERPTGTDPLACAAETLRKVRAAKTQSKRNLRWPVSELAIRGPSAHRRALQSALEDVIQAGAVEPGRVTLLEGPAPEGELFDVRVALAPEEGGERA